MTIRFFAMAGLALLVLPALVCAGGPTSTVEAQVNKLLQVLGDQSLEGEAGKSVKENKIRAISDDLFDYVELSRRTLGRNWKKIDAAQQTEFISLYRKLLESVYMGRLLEYSNEKVIFGKETMLSENRAEVQSNLVAGDKKIPIHYRLVLKAGNWKVYDIIIEGVSLVKNYRTQFNSMLSKGSPEEMLQALREKVAA